MKRNRLVLAGLATTALVALAGCGGGTTTSADSVAGEPEQSAVTVGVLPLADYAAVYWAEDHGFFDEVGLDVTFEPLQGGPVGVQRVTTGEIDFSFANSVSTVIAASKGAPVQFVVVSSGLGEGSNLIVVQPDSPIQTLADLDGKTVGVNTTNNIGDVTFRALAKSQGETAEPVFVEVPFNEMVAGVQAGSIDAGYVPEPFASAATGAGLREVVDLSSGVNTGLAAASFISSTQFIEQNPNTAEAFAAALYAAGEDISEKEDEFRTWLPTIANVPAEVAEQMALPIFYEELEVDKLQDVADVLIDQGIVTEFDASQHVFTGSGD